MKFLFAIGLLWSGLSAAAAATEGDRRPEIAPRRRRAFNSPSSHDVHSLRGGGGNRVVVKTGLERLCSSPSLARNVTGGRPTCILAHAASVLPDLTHAVDALTSPKSGVDLRFVLAPEHGFRGAQQAGHGGKNSTIDPRTGLTVYSIYQKSYTDIATLLVSSDCETVLIDLQDSGARFYTYIWSMYDVLVAAAGARGAGSAPKVVVLDRPNPLGGAIMEGPVLDPDFASGVGKRPISLRHGLTLGEAAKLFNEEFVPTEPFSQGRRANLQVVTMEGWARAMVFASTGLPYVPPSPNLPTFRSMTLYVGTGLIEGVNLSEGRGTALPFQFLGAPFVGWEFAANLRADLARMGCETEIAVREAYFVPVMSKHANKTCGGVEVMLLDEASDGEDALRVGIQIIKRAHDMYANATAGNGFAWVKAGSKYWVDLLTGNAAVRTGIDQGLSVDQIEATWQEELDWYKLLANKYLLY